MKTLNKKWNFHDLKISIVLAILTAGYLYFIPGKEKWYWIYNGWFSMAELVFGLPLTIYFLVFVYGILINFIRGILG